MTKDKKVKKVMFCYVAAKCSLVFVKIMAFSFPWAPQLKTGIRVMADAACLLYVY